MDPLLALTLVLAVVTAVSSAVAGHPSDAIGPVALLLTLTAVVMVVQSLGHRGRRMLVTGIVVLATAPSSKAKADDQPTAEVSLGPLGASFRLRF